MALQHHSLETRSGRSPLACRFHLVEIDNVDVKGNSGDGGGSMVPACEGEHDAGAYSLRYGVGRGGMQGT